MPAKKKAPAKKTAKKARKSPSKARKAPKRGTGTPKASKAVKSSPKPKRRQAKAVSEPAPPPPPPPDPDLLAVGSVSIARGRLRWACRKRKGGVDLGFVPSGSLTDPYRVEFVMEFKARPTGVSLGKVDGESVHVRFMPWKGWETGFKISVDGVDHAPRIG